MLGPVDSSPSVTGRGTRNVFSTSRSPGETKKTSRTEVGSPRASRTEERRGRVTPEKSKSCSRVSKPFSCSGVGSMVPGVPRMGIKEMVFLTKKCKDFLTERHPPGGSAQVPERANANCFPPA